MIFRWQLSLPPPRPLPVTSSTNSLSPVLLPHRRTYSKRNPYSRIEQTVELVTHTGNRHRVFLATPLNLFSNLPGPLPITSCEKNCEWNYGGYSCLLIFSVGKTWKSINVTDSAREILLSGAWTCQENFLDSWITPHVVKPFIKTWCFFFPFFFTILRLVMLQKHGKSNQIYDRLRASCGFLI